MALHRALLSWTVLVALVAFGCGGAQASPDAPDPGPTPESEEYLAYWEGLPTPDPEWTQCWSDDDCDVLGIGACGGPRRIISVSKLHAGEASERYGAEACGGEEGDGEPVRTVRRTSGGSIVTYDFEDSDIIPYDVDPAFEFAGACVGRHCLPQRR